MRRIWGWLYLEKCFLANELADKEHACMGESWETFHWSLTNSDLFLCHFSTINIYTGYHPTPPQEPFDNLCSSHLRQGSKQAKGWFPLTRNFYVGTYVTFTFAYGIEAVHERSLVGKKVKPRSTSRLISTLYILSLLHFTCVKVRSQKRVREINLKWIVFCPYTIFVVVSLACKKKTLTN